jgi:hypothetical protein
MARTCTAPKILSARFFVVGPCPIKKAHSGSIAQELDAEHLLNRLRDLKYKFVSCDPRRRGSTNEFGCIESIG